MIDFSALVSQLLPTYWWLLPLLIVAVLFKPAWFKGFIGENGQCVCPVASEYAFSFMRTGYVLLTSWTVSLPLHLIMISLLPID